MKSIGTEKSAHIVKPHPVSTHSTVCTLARKVAHIKCFVYHKVMNGVRPAKKEAEKLQGECPPDINHLGLLDNITILHIAKVMQIGGNKMQRKLANNIRKDNDINQWLNPLYKIL